MWKRSIVWGGVLLAIVSQIAAQSYETEGGSNRASDVSLKFTPGDKIVNPGERLQLDCGVLGEYRNCYWEREDGPRRIQVEDVHAGYINGMSKPPDSTETNNQCGLVIDSISAGDHGEWSCIVFVIGTHLSGSSNIIVTIKPTKPKLDVPSRPLLLQEGSSDPIKCTVDKARPPVKIHWYLDAAELTHASTTDNTVIGEKGEYKTVSTLNRKFGHRDNGKRLICSVEHFTLPEPDTDVVDLDIRFKPTDKGLTTYYKVNLGSQYEARLNFSANPKPRSVMWRYGDGFENTVDGFPVPGSDPNQHYIGHLEERGDGHYTAILQINGFTAHDASRRYVLRVENELGATDYHVMLSTREPPAAPLGSSAIAGIVIVVLIIIAAICIAAFLRFHQMYCFKPKKKSPSAHELEIREEHSDTESAHAASKVRKCPGILKNIQSFVKSRKNQESKPKTEDEAEDNALQDKDADMPEEMYRPKTGEVVYAELDLCKDEAEKKMDPTSEPKTEYAEIIGTVDIREEEKKE